MPPCMGGVGSISVVIELCAELSRRYASCGSGSGDRASKRGPSVAGAFDCPFEGALFLPNKLVKVRVSVLVGVGGGWAGTTIADLGPWSASRLEGMFAMGGGRFDL